jgi:AraC family transcriptional activator of pobA
MISDGSVTLIDPKTNFTALQVNLIDSENNYRAVQRKNYYSILFIKEGSGFFRVDMNQYSFDSNSMFFLTPYQPFQLQYEGLISGLAWHFHPDFFCIERHSKEVACNGILFNNVYEPPMIILSDQQASDFEELFRKFETEMLEAGLAQVDLLMALLKIFLINATRIKVQQHPNALEDAPGGEHPFILQKLKNHIEAHYREKHAPSDYASMLHITPKALGKIVKNFFNKTLSEIIHERIVTEAKRELYLTGKPVKQIAYELGFDDEFYFSRFFKKITDISPHYYRETVGSNRGGK